MAHFLSLKQHVEDLKEKLKDKQENHKNLIKAADNILEGKPLNTEEVSSLKHLEAVVKLDIAVKNINKILDRKNVIAESEEEMQMRKVKEVKMSPSSATKIHISLYENPHSGSPVEYSLLRCLPASSATQGCRCSISQVQG